MFLVACAPYKNYQESLHEPEKITKLKLSNGNFISTPQRIEEFENLEKLYLFNNKITTVSSEIGELKKLKRLVLSNNDVDSLPAAIGELESLEFLSLKFKQHKKPSPRNWQTEKFKSVEITIQ